MTHSEDSTEDFTDPFTDGLCTPGYDETMVVMDIDQQEEDMASDTDSIISASLPTSFLSSPGMNTLEQRRVSTPILSTPQTSINHMLLEGERGAAIPRRRVLMSIPQRDDDDVTSTPSRIHGSTAPLTRQTLSRSGSLLTRMHEKATLLGKHPQTPSPGEEPGTRSKGPKTIPSKEDDRPSTPDFSLPDTSGLDRSSSLYSPIPPPNFGTPPGTPQKIKPFGLSSSSQHSPVASSFGLSISDDNPFLGPSSRKARFDMDYLSESQWYSDYPHHLTKEYLEELFCLDKRVMFTKTKSGSGNSPDYLKSNFYVNEIVLGMGDFADVLKVQNKHSKEFFAVKRLLRTVQGAMERKQYLNEVRNMWRVERSPNVLELLEAWEQKGKIYMRMELCKLGSLKSALLAQKKYGGFDEQRTWKCLTDLASGLRAIHDSNVIHLDIKPENVFITTAGSLKIGDFGLSILYPVEIKDVNEGDKYYMAQELLNGQCGKHSDIFSLGVTIYEIVTNQTGELPGEGPQWHYLRDGEVDMSEYTVGENTLERSSSAEQQTDTSGFSQQSSMALTAALAIPTSAISSKSTPNRRLFSKELTDLIKDMMQPAYEQRPTASSILKSQTIQQIVARRTEQGRKGGRSDEAMSGLLLQSI